ncbi:hypothetical protein D3C87_430080 [compost metagenome]
MFRSLLLALVTAAVLCGCLLHTVLEPYAYGQKVPAPANQVATVWGEADRTRMSFLKVDGKGLPSRNFNGVPMALTLLPGRYTLEILYASEDFRTAQVELPVKLEAGHTYVVEHRIVGSDVQLALRDLGTAVTCRYERYSNMPAGYATRPCERRKG